MLQNVNVTTSRRPQQGGGRARDSDFLQWPDVFTESNLNPISILTSKLKYACIFVDLILGYYLEYIC